MPEFFVELTWRCAACAKDNRGRDKVCAGCGKPMKGGAFVDPAPSATPTSAVTEPEIVRQAGAGPDWRCVHCGSRQRRDDGACANCGGAQAVPSASHRPAVTSTASSTIPRPLAAATGSLGQAAATSRAGPATARAGKPRQLAIPFVLAPIVAFAGVILFPLLAALDVLPASLWLLFVLPAFSAVGALVLFFMGGTGVGVVRLPPKTVRPEPSGPWWTRRRTLGVAAALVAAVGAAAWICWPRVVDATVAERSWRHSVEVERYQLTREEGFDPPGDAVDRRSLGSRVHHTERRKVGEDVESYTESEPCGTSCTTTPVTCVD